MSAKEIKAGKAFVEVSIRDKLTQGLRSAWGKLKAFAAMVRATFFAITGTVAAVGAAIAAVTAPIVMLTRHFADMGSELNDLSAQTGISVAQLSAMKYAAEQTGASLEDLMIGIRTMQRKGVSPDKFEAIAKGITAIEDPTERAQAAMEIFGKSGSKLLPMLAEFGDLKARARSLGLIVTDQEAAQADELGDKYDDLGKTWDALKFKAGASFAPLMIRALEALTSLVVTLGRAFESLNVLIDGVSIGIASMAKTTDGVIRGVTGAMAVVLQAAEKMNDVLTRGSGTNLGSTALKLAGIGGGIGTASVMKGGAASKLAPGMTSQIQNLASAIRGGSFGTFSSPGAGLAGRAGQGIRREEETSKKMLLLLEKLNIKLDTLEDIDEHIQEMTVFES